MHYEFPKGLTIEEVREAVAEANARARRPVLDDVTGEPKLKQDGTPLTTGTTVFLEADRGDHVIFNYVVAFDGSFPFPNTGDAAQDRRYAILRECRGLTFHKATGRIVARKYAKFFNLNEKAETQVGVIDWSVPHVILEKLDGSMITPMYLGDDLNDINADSLRWGTKMGLTDVAAPVEAWVAKNPHYARYVVNPMLSGWTPIFEWTSRQQRIVIDYPDDRLVLTAMRNNETGEYLPYADLLRAEASGIDVVKALPGSRENIEQFMQEVYDCVGMEGYIFRFEDGLMLKIKGAWYCQIHGTKELLSREKDVVALIAWDRLDDAKAFMDESDRARVELFHKDYEAGVLAYADYLKSEVDNIVLHVGDNRKAFADEVKARSKGGTYREYDSGMIFSIRGGQDAATVVRQRVAKYAHPTAGTATRIDYIRPMIGGIDWNTYRDPNAVSGED